ncbi:MAG TPA: toprim domain-containing protein [Pyrinomonadaceae bacterium]|nr:toprim domain-containing protein [Pyrinomonadaceae bacterium]
MNQHRWVRVSRKHRCQICDKPDWCTYAPEAGIVSCMRVESDHPSRNSLGGWLHFTGDGYKPPYIPPAKPAIVERPPDLHGLWGRWQSQTDFHHLDGFAMCLGVDTDALYSTGCAWADQYHAWAFPMKDAAGEMIGIRLRSESGQKWAVKGSRQGLFIPAASKGATLYIVEGPTDTAAALTLGLNAIGRPSCMGCEEMVAEYTRRRGVRRVVVITDNDEPGLRGASRLQNALPVLSCLWTPPTKDIREFLQLEGNRSMIESCIKDLVWTPGRRQAA